MSNLRSLSSLLKLTFTLLFIPLAHLPALGQAAARPDRGVMPNSTYSVSDFENISLGNGNLNLSIPLASLPPIAGGKLSWTVHATYNSKLINITRRQENADPLSWQPYTVNQIEVADGGWKIGGRYDIRFRSSKDDFNRLTYPTGSLSTTELNYLNNSEWRKVVLIMPDGSEHELRPTDLSPYPGSQDFLKGFYDIASGTTRRFYSIDGSFLYAKITSANEWTVTMKDGTQIIQTTDGVQRVQDTNGNKIKIFSDTYGDHYQDEQTGREILVTFNPSGFGGQGQTQVKYRSVTGTEYHVDINHGTTTVRGKIYEVSDWQTSGGEGGGFVCSRYQQMPTTNISVIREIVLPQSEPSVTRKFEFAYNSDDTTSASDSVSFVCGESASTHNRTASIGWGEVSEITTPSGAVINYDYKFDNQHSLGTWTDDITTQSVETKTLSHDSTSDVWTYVTGNGSGSVTGPDGATTTDLSYYCNPDSPGCYGQITGLSYRITSPFRRVDRHWIGLAFSGGNSDTPGGTKALNSVVDKEYTTLTDGSGNALRMSAKAYSYDYNGNLLETKEYDWFDPALVSRDGNGVPTGIPGGATLLRTIDSSYYNDSSSSSSSNVYAKRSLSTGLPLILDRLKENTVGSAITRLSYDSQSYGTDPTVGNLTTKAVWNNVDSAWITTSNTYGTYGNLDTSTDARGNVTEYFYDDSQLALPTRVRVDPDNGTGTQTVTTAYDYYTGLVTSQTDVNGQTTTIDYTNHLLSAIDPFGRPGIKKAPTIGGQRHRVTTTYYDSSRQVVIATDLSAENDKLLKTRTTVDQLGRPVLAEQTEDGTNYTISSVTAYKDMGKVTLQSSARRSSSSSTDSWTRVTKDTAGRVTEVASFGGATQPGWTGTSGTFTGNVTTAYDAEYTTVTDQQSKVRRSKSNALGQLIRVDEPNSSGVLGSTSSPNQPTSYDYDVYGNLTTVTQGSQTRTFTYDTLSRLRSAANPESGTATYTYDDNGNILVRTDARSISTHYAYDSLNRLTRRWYNTSSSVGSTTHTSTTTDEAYLYYDSQSLPSGAPSYSHGSAVGRLVAQTYGGSTSSTGDYFAYDVLGRVTSKYQRTGSVNYLTSASYILSGAVDTMTYPSGRTVTNSYDSAARLTGVAGTLGDGTSRTYSTAITYMPTGAFSKEQFGTTTAVYNKAFYNSRGQLSEIRVSSTSGTDTSWNRGAIINHYSDQCWGMCSGNSFTDNNGNLQKQEIYIPADDAITSYHMKWQQYTYDSLNRLASAREVLDGGSEQWKQQFTYDRYGNRTIDATNSSGGVNEQQFSVDTSTNRLGVPGGGSGTMTYDAAGNLTNDTYTGAGTRTYDAENKIVSAMGGSGTPAAQTYVYDVSGNRIKRTVDSVETWQVYGIGGELVAEYAASGAANSPQKEYGYRNGELLITAEVGARTNVALSSNGSSATASSTYSPSYAASNAINGNRASGEWNDNTVNSFPDYLEVTFPSSKTINEVDVFMLQDNYMSPSTPTEAMTFVNYGLTSFDVEYWNGSSWTTIPGGSITSNNHIWRKITFSPITTTKVRVVANASPDGASRVVELEAWEPATGGVHWLVADQLGTPRMIFDESGILVNVKRHDYLPFGEELGTGFSGRSTGQGYGGGDGVRQQFTGQERDTETGLDYFNARFFSSIQGRFVSPDPLLASAHPGGPQSWNRYSYALNNPLRVIDPTGMEGEEVDPQKKQPEPAPQVPLPQEIVDLINKSFGMGTYTDTAGNNHLVIGTDSIVEKVIEAATVTYNQSLQVFADMNGGQNNGMSPQTTEVTTKTEEDKVKIGASAMTGPNYEVTPGTTTTTTKTEAPVQARLAAIDSNITMTSARLGAQISNMPVTIVNQTVERGPGTTAYFNRRMAGVTVARVLTAARNQAGVDSEYLRPIKLRVGGRVN